MSQISTTRRRGILAVLILALPTCGTPQSLVRSGLVIENVTVIDVARLQLRPATTVVIEGSRIVAVRPAAELVPGPAVVRVDGRGKFLVPGLWDMHVHSVSAEQEPALPLFIANGVTGVRDMWGQLAFAREAWSAIAAGRRVGPRMVVAGTIVDGVRPWWSGSIGVDAPDRARAVVDSLAAEGAAFVKVYSLLEPAPYYAILQAARARGLPAAGHVPFAVTAAEAADSGQVSFEHLFGVMEGCSRAEPAVAADRARWLADRAAGRDGVPHPFFDVGMYARLVEGFDPARCEALLRRLAQNGTWQVPTLVVNRMEPQLRDSAFTADERLTYLPAEWSRSWQALARRARAQPETSHQRQLAFYRKKLEVVGLAARLGVPLLAGTDVGNPFAFPGFSLHDELTLLVEAGLTPGQALQAATIGPAQFLRATDSLGTIEVGKLADLVLLDADPLARIESTRAIAGVVANGRLFRRSDLDRLLTEVRAWAARPAAGDTTGQ